MPTLLAALKTERGRHVALSMLLTGLSASFVFCGYEFLRSPVESIFLGHFGAKYKPMALAFVPVMMFAFIYLYGRLLSAVGGAKAMAISMLSSAAVFLLAFFMVRSGSKPWAFFLFIFKESYVVIISEQFWSFINSTLKDEEGRVFNGPVAGFGALGSVIGGYFVGRLAVSMGTEPFIALSAAALLPAAALIVYAYRQAGEPRPSPEEEHGKLGHLHLGILRENRTVFMIALIIFSTQVVSTLLDLRFSQLAQAAITDRDMRTAYFGSFWMKVNIFSFSMQFLLAPIMLRYLPIRSILIAIPLIHLTTSAALFVWPSMGLGAMALLLFKGLDYSIFRAAKETLYIPFSYDTRYRAKQVADAFSYRFSKGVTAAAIAVATPLVAIPAGFFPAAAGFFAAMWATFSSKLEHKEAPRAV